MEKEITVVNTSIKFKGFFHMKLFYTLIRDWLRDEGFHDTEGSDEYYENLYLQKETAAGKELIIIWDTEEIPFKSKYYKKKINIKYHCLELKPAEAIYKGRKIKINKGEVELIIKATIETDYLDRIKNHPILGMFEKFIRERLLKKNLEALERDLYRDVMRLQGTLKAYLHMKTFAQPVETLHPPKW